MQPGPARPWTPSTHVSSSYRNWEVPPSPSTAMNGGGKSDGPTVPQKSPNNGGDASSPTEGAKGRRLTKDSLPRPRKAPDTELGESAECVEADTAGSGQRLRVRTRGRSRTSAFSTQRPRGATSGRGYWRRRRIAAEILWLSAPLCRTPGALNGEMLRTVPLSLDTPKWPGRRVRPPASEDGLDLRSVFAHNPVGRGPVTTQRTLPCRPRDG